MPSTLESPPLAHPAHRPRPDSRRWLIAVLAGCIGSVLRSLLQPLLGDQIPFVLAFPVTAFVALMWGTGPGLVTAGICGLAVALPFLPPSLSMTNRPLQVGAFMVSAILICLVCGQLSRRTGGADDAGASTVADSPLTLWLRAVLWGAVLIPSAAFASACWWGYERAVREAEDDAVQASALAMRHAERSFAIARTIAERVLVMTQMPDDAARSREADIHQRLADIVSGVPWVVNLNVWDREGHALVRSDVYPAGGGASVADRAYFIDQREGRVKLGVSEVLTGRQTGLPLLNITLRRSLPDGAFGGVVAVSLSPGHFIDYYKSLGAEQPNLASFALIRTDGALLARWPELPDKRRNVSPGNPVLAQMRAGAASGIVEMPSAVDGSARLLHFRQVPGLPLVVTAGLSKSAMLAGWLRFVALLAVVMVPTTFGLVYVSWVALKKTRREQAVLVELRDQHRRRIKAEQTLVQTQKLEAMAQLTGGVAHDFNNLLTIVSTSLHILQRRQPELAGNRQLEAMSRAIQSGVRLTRQLLSFSRRQALRPETVRLQQWLPAAEDLVRSTLGRSVALELHIESDTHPITVDLAELELALINTALNAQHAMPDGGLLRISARNAPPGTPHDRPETPPMVLISVQDSGIGIAPELLGKVFEPFFTTREAGRGTGLGLSQVYGLCAQAGGHAAIDSTLNQGTTIKLYFPRAVVEVPPSEASHELPPGRLDGHLLLVEDNEEVASATTQLLQAAGLRVTRVDDADKALAWLAECAQAPDVVLSDISMPGSIDGIGLAFRLRELRPALPVLLTTGYAQRIDDAIAGNFPVLPKPTPAEELLGELSKLLAKRRAGA